MRNKQSNSDEANVEKNSCRPVLLEEQLCFLSAGPKREWDEEAVLENKVAVSGQLVVDPRGLMVYRQGKSVELSRSEYTLASTLLLNHTMMIDREKLLDLIERCFSHSLKGNTLSKYIHLIRDKLQGLGAFANRESAPILVKGRQADREYQRNVCPMNPAGTALTARSDGASGAGKTLPEEYVLTQRSQGYRWGLPVENLYLWRREEDCQADW